MEESSLLALSIDLNRIRACLLDWVSDEYRLLGWYDGAIDAEISTARQVARATTYLGLQLERTLWDEEGNSPFLVSDDPIRYPPLDQVAITASLYPRLRVWLAGLNESISLASARQAVASSPAIVVGRTRLSIHTDVAQIVDDLSVAQPDVLIIVGGYDVRGHEAEEADGEKLGEQSHSTQEALHTLCTTVGEALHRLPANQRPNLIYAGNRWYSQMAQQQIMAGQDLLAEPISMEVVENVQPTPERSHHAPLARSLDYHYWRLCQRSPDFRQLEGWVTSPVHMTTLEWSFTQLVKAWSHYQGLPQLHGLLCGSSWWLHVWATQAESEVRMQFVEPNTRPPALDNWPDVQLISGAYPVHLWPSAAFRWWDRNGLAPLIATIGQVAPLAMLQVLTRDVFETRGRSL